MGYQEYVSRYEHHHSVDSANSPDYRISQRESDKILLSKIDRLLPLAPSPGAVLDLCCSTGNLLFHLKNRHPELRLCGADLAADIIQKNREDQDLEGIDFRVADIVKDDLRDVLGEFSVVTVNAALQFLGPAELAAAVKNIAPVIRPGGYFLNFDGYQPYSQELMVHAKTQFYPQGVTRYYPHTGWMSDLLTAHGFRDIVFEEFKIPIDLPESPDAPADLTRTVTLADGHRLQFVGAIFQPWCFLTARKI